MPKKYAGNLIQGPFSDADGIFGKSLPAQENQYKSGVSLSYRTIHQAGPLPDEPHSHPFHQIIAFIGGNPENIQDFGAEIHVFLGEEKEEHIITDAAVVSIPPGMLHGIPEVARCDKPVVMLEISTNDSC